MNGRPDMGDVSAEPSMEDILSSIKRIISEEGDGPVPSRARRAVPSRVEPLVPPPADRTQEEDDDQDEVLELSNPVPDPAPTPSTRPTPSVPDITFVARDNEIVSSATAEAARDALKSLSKLIVKPDPRGDATLEGLVREMLRPMLKDWIDAHLPGMVEQMVSREIERITSAAR